MPTETPNDYPGDLAILKTGIKSFSFGPLDLPAIIIGPAAGYFFYYGSQLTKSIIVGSITTLVIFTVIQLIGGYGIFFDATKSLEK